MSRRVTISVSVLVVLAFTALALLQGFDANEVDRLIEVLEIEQGEVVADVGAGDGTWSAALAERVGGSGRIYATEVDRDDLKKIRDRIERAGLDNVLVVEGTQNETGLPPACCDAILLRRVYHHFQEPGAMRASLKQALSDDGLLLIVDFDTKRYRARPSGIPRVSRRPRGRERGGRLRDGARRLRARKRPGVARRRLRPPLQSPLSTHSGIEV